MKKVHYVWYALLVIFIIGCSTPIPKPLSDSDKQKITESLSFNDTDMDKGEIGGSFNFTPPEDVNFPKEIKEFVFVLGATTEVTENPNCSDGKVIGSTANPITAEGGYTGEIADDTEFIEGLHILLCFRNQDIKEGPNTIFSGGFSNEIIDNVTVAEESAEQDTTDEMASTEVARLSDDTISALAAIDALFFEDTDPDENQVGGPFEFDQVDIVIPAAVTDLVYVYVKGTDSKINDESCNTGKKIGYSQNGSGFYEGYIDQNSEFTAGDYLIVCLAGTDENGDITELVYSGYSTVVLDDVTEEEVMVEEEEEITDSGAMMDTDKADNQDNKMMPDNPFDLVYFDFDKYNVDREYSNMISYAVRELPSKSQISIVVEGHADERGSDEYNLALSERRANEVRKVLIRNGIASSRITIIPYGEHSPVSYGKTEIDYSKNRRAVIVVQ